MIEDILEHQKRIVDAIDIGYVLGRGKSIRWCPQCKKWVEKIELHGITLDGDPKWLVGCSLCGYVLEDD